MTLRNLELQEDVKVEEDLEEDLVVTLSVMEAKVLEDKEDLAVESVQAGPQMLGV